jgi:hypothetical protein
MSFLIFGFYVGFLEHAEQLSKCTATMLNTNLAPDILCHFKVQLIQPNRIVVLLHASIATKFSD